MAKSFDFIIDEVLERNFESDSIAYSIIEDINELASCNYVARTSGVVSGLEVAQSIYKKINPKISFKILKSSGSYINRGDVLAVISGPIASIIKGEKVALNFVRYMSAIASKTNKYLLELTDTDTSLVYSDYSNPLLMELSKQAFIDGGGYMPETKYNVITSNILTRFESIDQAIAKLKMIEKSSKVCVEVENVEDFEQAFLSSAQVIRLSTNKFDIMDECASINNGKKILEIVADVDVKKVRSIAKLGFRRIIIPSITDDSSSLPISLCFYKRYIK